MARFSIFIFLIVCIMPILAQAAVLSGTVYNEFLEVEPNVVILVDGERFVSSDGEYSFVLQPGEYEVTYQKLGREGLVIYSQVEHIAITQEKEYIFDAILLLSLENSQVPVDQSGTNYFESMTSFAIFFSVILVLAAGWLLRTKQLVNGKTDLNLNEQKLPEKVVERSFEDVVIEFIKEAGGRVTQKDIRKRFPASEAKISLMLSELEHDGVVRKLKKGRGNIVLLQL